MKSAKVRTILVGMALGWMILLANSATARDPASAGRDFLAKSNVVPQAGAPAASRQSWARKIEFGYYAYRCGNAIVSTGDGGLVVAGVGGYNSASSQGERIIVMELRPSGKVDWRVSCASGANEPYDTPQALVRTSDDKYLVVGTFGEGYMDSGDMFAMKLAGNGRVSWFKTYGRGANDRAFSVQTTSDGGYIVAGETELPSADGTDALILKLDSSGKIEWQRSLGGDGREHLYSILVMPDGGYLAVGATSNWPESKAWVIRLRPAGDLEWQRSYILASSSWQEARSVCHSADGGYLVAGTMSDGYPGNSTWSDFFILKLDSLGNTTWQKEYKDLNNALSTGRVIVPLRGGNFLLAGSKLALELSPNGSIVSKAAFRGEKVDDTFGLYGACQADNGTWALTGDTGEWGASLLVMSLNRGALSGSSCVLIETAAVSVTSPSVVSKSTSFSSQLSPAKKTTISHDFFIPDPDVQVRTVCNF